MQDSVKHQGSENGPSGGGLSDEGIENLVTSLQDIHKDIRLISTDMVVVSEWVRFKCRYGCPSFGRTLSCPPFSPTPEETRRLLAEYRTAVLVHAQTSPDAGYTTEQHRRHVKECRARLHMATIEMERAAFLQGYYKAFAMGATPCSLCEDCVVKERSEVSKINGLSTLDCRHKDIMRPPMDAFGIDMFQTARNAGYSIKVLKSYSDVADLYSMVLIE
jgi:predicted metal-binding protein